MKKITVVAIGLILVSSVFAQPGARRGLQGDCEQSGKRMEEKGIRGDNREEMTAFMLSNRLELTTEQADMFFPRFREYQEEMGAIREEIRDANKDIRDKIEDNQEISNAELNKAIKNINTLRDKQGDAKQKFIGSLDDILDNTQIAKLALAPKDFQYKKMMKKGNRPQNRR